MEGPTVVAQPRADVPVLRFRRSSGLSHLVPGAALRPSRQDSREGHSLCSQATTACSVGLLAAVARTGSSHSRKSCSWAWKRHSQVALAAKSSDTRSPDSKPEVKKEEEEEKKTIAEQFDDFTRVLPWFNFAATVLESHVERSRARQETLNIAPALLEQVSESKSASRALRAAIERERGSEGSSQAFELPEVLDAILDSVAGGRLSSPCAYDVIESLKGRWEVVWGGGFSPLHRIGLAKQCLWLEVQTRDDGSAPVLTVHSGLPLVLFGAYAWTSVAGEIIAGKPLDGASSKPLVLEFNRYWVDIGGTPRPDIGRIDGGLINDRISAFGAALLTPVLLEFGALKWLLNRIGIDRVFEVDVQKDDGSSVKLEASLELYLTLLAMVAFPPTLSTCPVPYVDVEEGLCVYEIPMLGPFADLPRWAHPGGNAAVLVARRLAANEEPSLMLP